MQKERPHKVKDGETGMKKERCYIEIYGRDKKD
jgi:hypothetical protein